MNPDLPKCFYRISVKAIVLDETRKKFLVLEEKKGVFDMPGGGLDWGANYKDELRREIEEEMGLEVEWISEKPFHFLTWKDKNNGFPKSNVFYEVKLKNLDFTPSDECVAIKFVSPEEIKEINAIENVVKFADFFSKNPL